MRIICPNCAAEYEVEAAMIPDAGRDVQCSACGHTWMQFSDGCAEKIAPSGPAVGGDDASGAEAVGDDASDAGLPETEPAAADAEGTATSGRRQLDDDIRRILKEEADREAAARKARRRETETPPETQGDLGLRDAPTQRVDTRDPSPDDRAVEQDDDTSRDGPTEATQDPWRPEDTAAPAADPAPDRDAARRSRGNRLPDIEEINSSLSARPHDAGETTDPDDTTAAPTQDTGFRSGFILMLSVALILIALYLLAPRIAEAVPAAEPAMRAYVDAANVLRTNVNDALQSAADAIGGAVEPSDP